MLENYEPSTIFDPAADNVIFESRIRFTLPPKAAHIPDSGFVLWDDVSGNKDLKQYVSSGICFPDGAGETAIFRLRTSGAKTDWSTVKASHLMHTRAFESTFRNFNEPAELLDP
jgi:hypothetical protein